MKYLILLLSILFILRADAQQVTWSSEVTVAMSMDGNLHPRVVTDASGNPMIIWGKGSSNECKFSKWNGTMFTSPITINSPSIPVFTASWAGPDIASRGDTVYIVIKETPEDVNPIYIVSSFDGGQTFSSPVQVDFVSPDLSRFPTVTIDDSGNPIVGFMKLDANFSNARWVVTRSSDYGNTFTTDVLASGWSGGVVCDCCPSSIVSEGNTVAMLYRDNLNNIRDSWTSISMDNGISFTNGWNVDLNNWMIMACPSTGPDGVIINDSLYSVFMNAATGSPKVYFSSSSITNMQPTFVQQLSGNTDQNYPRISKYDSALGVVWKETVSGENKALFRFSTNINSGLSLVFDTIANSGVANVDIAISNGMVYVVWQDDFSGTVKFKSGRYTSTTNIKNVNDSQSIQLYPNPVNTNEFQVLLNNLPDGYYNYTIENVIGQSTGSHTCQLINGQTKIKTSLMQGIYVLKMSTDKGGLTIKFIKE